jgi:hypothetical protein
VRGACGARAGRVRGACDARQHANATAAHTAARHGPRETHGYTARGRWRTCRGCWRPWARTPPWPGPASAPAAPRPRPPVRTRHAQPVHTVGQGRLPAGGWRRRRHPRWLGPAAPRGQGGCPHASPHHAREQGCHSHPSPCTRARLPQPPGHATAQRQSAATYPPKTQHCAATPHRNTATSPLHSLHVAYHTPLITTTRPRHTPTPHKPLPRHPPAARWSGWGCRAGRGCSLLVAGVLTSCGGVGRGASGVGRQRRTRTTSTGTLSPPSAPRAASDAGGSSPARPRARAGGRACAGAACARVHAVFPRGGGAF